jgi:WD40 repeat protein
VDGHRGTVRALAFVAGGAGLASAADDQQVALWGLPGARARHQRQPGTRGIEALVASPDGRRWLAAHEDGSASILSRDGDPERTLGHHPGGCHAAAWSPDGAVLATGGADGLVRLWGARRGDLRAEGKAPGAVQSLVFIGENLLVGGERGLGRWPLPLAARVPSLGLGALRLTPIPGAAIEEHLTGCRALATRGEAVAVASDGGRAFLGDGNRRWRPLALHRGALWSLAFAPDGALLACGEEGAVTLHDARFAERLVRIEVPGGRLWSLAFAPDGQRLAAACQDGLVRVVGLQSGRVEEELPGHTDEVTAVHWAPDDTLHSAGRDGALIRWERRAPGASDLSASASAGGARPGSG